MTPDVIFTAFLMGVMCGVIGHAIYIDIIEWHI